MKRWMKQWLAACLVPMLVCVVVPFSPAVDAASSAIFYEGFDDSDSMPNGWTTYDADGDGNGWGVSTNVYNSYNSSGHCVFSTSAKSWTNYLYPDDWMMTPAIAIPDNASADYHLSFQIYTSYMSGYTDYIQVYASASPIADPTALTADAMILDGSYSSGNAYQEMTADLNAYRGKTVYLAFRHHTATGLWQMYLDEVQVLAVEPDTHTVKVTGNTQAYEVIPATGSFEALDGRDYTFTVDVADRYDTGHGYLTVTANGKELIAENGVYTLPKVSKKQTLEIVYSYATGDINGDGVINMRDPLILYSAVAGNMMLDPVQEQAALIDVRDNYTMIDSLLLYSYANGSRTYINVNEDLSLIWKSAYADATNGFASSDSVSRSAYYYNNKKNRDYAVKPAGGDVKQLFYNDRATRAVNLADGYAMTLPYTDMRPDYSLGEYRSRYESDTTVLNVSHETKNPYGNTAGSWNTYLTEWLNRFVANDSFLSANSITRTRATTTSTTALSGYTVLNYDLYIENDDSIEMPYYNIAVIRKSTEYVEFFLLVMKSTTDQSAAMDTIVKSFKEIDVVGKAQNVQETYACDVPDYWNAETKAYYNKLLTQNSTDWGFFSASMTYKSSSDYATQDTRIQNAYNELSTALDYDYEIMPTYTHIGWGKSTLHSFPSDMAQKYAGGNGFNGKPVLQMSYQFTTSNNTNLEGYTPMFDVLRGEYDDLFCDFARDIKAYGKPVLFRLNNEMNTDWTSYAGIVTLLDPDIFAMTWERMYEIFLEEGVDNCIWIFNPMADTTPYCNWGEHLCYLPDMDYVQVVGLTSYEMGNDTELTSFKDRYSALYEKNTPYFADYPWIISEFGCGAGGERQYNWSTLAWEETTLGRNAIEQAQWVDEMFDCFAHRTESGYEFADRIKGAVWFSCNDYVSIDSTNYIKNYFELDSGVPLAVEALKNGLAAEQ